MIKKYLLIIMVLVLFLLSGCRSKELSAYSNKAELNITREQETKMARVNIIDK